MLFKITSTAAHGVFFLISPMVCVCEALNLSAFFDVVFVLMSLYFDESFAKTYCPQHEPLTIIRINEYGISITYLHCPTSNSGYKLKLFKPRPSNNPRDTIQQGKVHGHIWYLRNEV